MYYRSVWQLKTRSLRWTRDETPQPKVKEKKICALAFFGPDVWNKQYKFQQFDVFLFLRKCWVKNPISKDLNANEKGCWTDGFKIYGTFPFFWFVLAEPPSWPASPSPGSRLRPEIKMFKIKTFNSLRVRLWKGKYRVCLLKEQFYWTNDFTERTLYWMIV